MFVMVTKQQDGEQRDDDEQRDEQQQVEQMILQSSGYDFVRFTISDIHGIAKTRVVPNRHLKHAIKNGPQVCQAAIYYAPTLLEYPGITCSIENMATRPMPGTFYQMPWATEGQYKVGEFLCEPYDIKSGSPLPATPRAVARHQLQRLSNRGLTILSACEMEFQLVDKDDQGNDYKPIFPKLGFGSSTGFAAIEQFLLKLDTHLHKAGVDVESLQEEAGAAQFELVLHPTTGIEAADMVFKFKQATREISMQDGMYAVFMSMPFPPFGNGLHFNHSILESGDGGLTRGRNVFYDPDGEDNLSMFARHWIAGIMKHAKALTALCAPTVNCYRRLHQPWAPDKVNWGLDDRYASLRVKNNGPTGTYMENRLPSGTANPYLVLAATIAAGLDGLEKELPCPAPCKARDCDDRLPDTLKDAVDILKADDALCTALGKEFIERWLEEKELGEIAEFPNWTPQSEDTIEKERFLYLDHM